MVIQRKDSGSTSGPQWVWSLYYIIAGWWILNGAWNGIQALTDMSLGLSMSVAVLLVSLLMMVVGIGLIARVEAARGAVNILCWLQILMGSLQLLFGLMTSSTQGILMSVIMIGMAILMLFVLGETETHAPNI